MDEKQRKPESDTLAPIKKYLRGKTCWDFMSAAQAEIAKKNPGKEAEAWTSFLEHACSMALVDALCTTDPIASMGDDATNYHASVGRSIAFLLMFHPPTMPALAPGCEGTP